MARGLFDYAEDAPQIERPEAGADPIREYIQDTEEIARLQASVAAQIEQGKDPHVILFSAIKLIGVLTGADEWTTEQLERLEATYKDVEQQELFTESQALIDGALLEQKREYAAKLSVKLNRIIRECESLTISLQTARDAAERMSADLEAPQPTEPDYNKRLTEWRESVKQLREKNHPRRKGAAKS